MHIKIPPYPRRVQLDFNFNLIQTTITGKVQQSGRLNVWFNMGGGSYRYFPGTVCLQTPRPDLGFPMRPPAVKETLWGPSQASGVHRGSSRRGLRTEPPALPLCW